MKANKIDHICIAVKNLEEARKVWQPILGRDRPDDAYVDEPEKIRVARYWVGDVGFELMESLTPDGEVAKFIAKRGDGGAEEQGLPVHRRRTPVPRLRVRVRASEGRERGIARDHRLQVA